MLLIVYVDFFFYKKFLSYVSDLLRDGFFYYMGYYFEDGVVVGFVDLMVFYLMDIEDNFYILDGDLVLVYCIEKNLF